MDCLPMMAPRTLVLVRDFDLFKAGEKDREEYARAFAQLPDYCCLVFVYDLIPYKGMPGPSWRRPSSRTGRWSTSHGRTRGPGGLGAPALPGAGQGDRHPAGLRFDLPVRGPDDKSDWGDREDRGICQGRADHPGGHRRGGHPQLDAVVFRMTDAIGEGNFDRAASVLGSCTRCRSRPSASCGLWAGRCASSTPPGWPSRRGRGPLCGGAVGAEAPTRRTS